MASRDNPVQIKQLRDFTGGMVVPRTSGFAMGSNVLENVTNMFYDESGRLSSAGLSMLTTSDAGHVAYYKASTTSIQNVVFWYPYIFIVDQDKNLWSNEYNLWDFSGIVDTTLADSRSSFAPLGDTMYVSYITGDTHKFTGGTWSTITDHTLDGSGNEFPQAAIILNAHDRMFAFNTSAHKSRIYFSDAGDAETWQSDNWIDVGVDDSENISAAVLYRNVIIIFKETGVWMLSGTDPDSFTLTMLSDVFGNSGGPVSVPSRSIAVGDGYVYWVDTNSGGIVTFDGTDINPLDPPMPQPINFYTAARRVFYHEHRLYVSGGGYSTYPYITYVFDTKTRAWTTVGWAADCFASYLSPYQYFTYMMLGGVKFDGETSGYYKGLYLFDSFNYGYELQGGLTDYPTWSFKTGWISLVDLATRFRIKYVDVLLASNNVATDAPVTITMYTNYDLGASATKTFTWGQDGDAQRLRLPAKLDLASGPRRIESIQLKVSTDGSAKCPASLVGIDIGFSVPPIRQRGARLITEVAS